jgi:hypothetical protein
MHSRCEEKATSGSRLMDEWDRMERHIRNLACHAYRIQRAKLTQRRYRNNCNPNVVNVAPHSARETTKWGNSCTSIPSLFLNLIDVEKSCCSRGRVRWSSPGSRHFPFSDSAPWPFTAHFASSKFSTSGSNELEQSI